MRAPRPLSEPRSIRRPSLWVGLLLPVVMAAVVPPTRADDSNWRLARRGRELFLRDWRTDDARCHGGDGLGPLYNASSCVACHGLGGPGGAGSASTNVDLLNLAKFQSISLATEGVPQAQRGQGRQSGPVRKVVPVVLNRDAVIQRLHPGLRESASIVLHHFAVDPEYRPRQELLLALKGPLAVSQGIRGISDGSGGTDDAALIRELRSSRLATVTQRNPTPLFGVGLIDSIPDEAIYAAAKEVAPGSGELHGRVHRLKGGRVGKFGWKAQLGSLQEFVLTACANELGLENPGHHQAASPFNPDSVARASDLTGAECDALVAYVRDLPRPSVLDLGTAASASAAAGRRLFDSTGCGGCHRPSLGGVDGLYSDLLLHDLGRGLSDSGQYYGGDDSDSSDAPKSSEWRTPPLWGLRESAPYLHDGRAATVGDAISQHGGEGEDSARRFAALSIEEQFHLESFLKTLTAPARPAELASRTMYARVDWARGLTSAEAQAADRDRQRVEEKARARELAEKERIERVEKRPDSKLRIARMTESNGHPKAALGLYRELVQLHPETRAAREARERIDALAK